MRFLERDPKEAFVPRSASVVELLIAVLLVPLAGVERERRKLLCLFPSLLSRLKRQRLKLMKSWCKGLQWVALPLVRLRVLPLIKPHARS